MGTGRALLIGRRSQPERSVGTSANHPADGRKLPLQTVVRLEDSGEGAKKHVLQSPASSAFGEAEGWQNRRRGVPDGCPYRPVKESIMSEQELVLEVEELEERLAPQAIWGD